MTSLFAGIQDAPLDPIMRLFEAFNADPSPKKLNLVVGVYTDADGKVPRLRAVQTAEKRWIEKGLPKTYRPIEGTKPFRDAVQELLFGKGAPILSQNRAATLQSIGGTGALKTGADLLAKLYPNATVAVSNPSWENHKALFGQAGFTVVDYPYFSAETGGADYPAMKAYLGDLPKGSIVVLHACCHNPTGADLGLDEWRDLVPLMAERGLIPFLDIAYQGFGNGLDADAEPVRLFAESGQEFLVASSFSKSFSLYGERVGALTIVAENPAAKAKVEAFAKRLVRASYSNPHTHGAAIVEIVLTDPELRADWERELGEMRDRIRAMRERMADSLQQRHPERGFDAIKVQKGMFSYTGLSPAEATRLREEHEVYALETGRICVAAVNTHNIDHVIDAIDAVVKGLNRVAALKRVCRFNVWINPVFDARLGAEPDIDLQVGDLQGPEDALAALLARAHVLHVSPARDELPRRWHVTDALLAECPDLLAVSSAGAGFDTVDAAACTRAGVAVVNQVGGNVRSVAELAIGLMLAVSRKICVSDRLLRTARGFTRESLMGHEIGGATLGLIGIGHTGREVAKLARGFDMRVIAHDPLLPDAEIRARGAEPVDRARLLAEADIVSLHCPLDDTTRGSFDTASFAAMKRGALFITTARGGVHDEAALAAALTAGHLAGAGLDVWAPEPPPLDAALLQLDTVVATYHTAGVTHEARRNVAAWGAEQIVGLLRGETPPRLVNPEVWPAVLERRARLLGGA